MSDVTITYKGSPIATMDASGTKTLTTQGKYCEANIGVEYVKPSGGTPAIAIVDTPDSHGGTVREITALDISDSTLETADQLAQGVTGYNKNGVKLTGTGSGDDSTKKTVSDSVVSFSDAIVAPIQSLMVNVEPIQDLHGYDSPWPAGGGKNLLDWNKVSVSGTHYGLTFSKGVAEGTITISGTLTYDGGAVAPISYADTTLSGKGYAFLTEHISGDSVIELSRTYGFRTENERAIAIFLNGTAGQSYTETIRVSVYAPPAPASWTPYSNICPISGRTSATVTRTGKNLCGTEQLSPTSYWGGSYDALVNLINLLPVGTYTLSHKATILTLPDSGSVMHGAFYVTALIDGSQVPISMYRTATDDSPTVGKVYEDSTTFTISAANKGKCNHVYAYCDSSVHTGAGRGSYQIYNIQLELGSTATAYEPYQGNTYTIQLGDTVYGGKIDATTGKMVIDRVTVEYDGSSDEHWGEYGIGSDSYCCVSYPNGKEIGYQKSICNEFKNVNKAFTLADYGVYSDHPTLINTYFRMPNADVNTKSEFLAWIAQHPIQLVYELDTPIEIPQQIDAFQGTNTVWSDAGDVTVTYLSEATTSI